VERTKDNSLLACAWEKAVDIGRISWVLSLRAGCASPAQNPSLLHRCGSGVRPWGPRLRGAADSNNGTSLDGERASGGLLGLPGAGVAEHSTGNPQTPLFSRKQQTAGGNYQAAASGNCQPQQQGVLSKTV